MLIEVLGDLQIFSIRFSPYNSKSESLQCSIEYNELTQYVHSVGVGKKQNLTQSYFFFAGEIISNKQSLTSLSHNNSFFIGILSHNDSKNDQDTKTSLNCDHFQYESFQFISEYDHQEFFVFSVEPYGQYAIGLAKDFVFIYQPFSGKMIEIKNSSLVWPTNTTFLPIAADTHVLYTIVVGFVINGPLFRVRATPTVYVISNSNLTILSIWSYTAALNSWQSYLTYSNLKKWSNQYAMSININPDDASQVLVGMPFLNIVFLLIITMGDSNIKLSSFIDNGNSIGFGKSVTWLPNSDAAILNSNYLIHDSSKIYLYKSLNETSLSSPTTIFPNIHQPLPSTINSHLIRMISTPTSLVLLAIDGGIFHILPSPPGYFSSTTSVITDSISIASEPMICMPGTYKSETSIFPCSLCPNGTKNSGGQLSISCINCSSDSFCPIGSVIDLHKSVLYSQLQASVHPRSPEVIIFDEILLQNMFSINSTYCMLISPLFWVLIVIGIVIVILIGMGILKRYVKHPKCHQVRHHVKNIFRQIDLIHEGEMWICGLVSVGIIVLLSFAYTFSVNFYLEYPSEHSTPATFVCNEQIRNVKYESGLQSLAIPASKEEQPMLYLLNKQHFTVQLDLLNTVASCQSLSVEQIRESTAAHVASNCTDSMGILSSILELPYHRVILKWNLNDIAFIGAIRIRLSANENKNDLYKLKSLNFSETFYDNSNRTLAQTIHINLELTKVIFIAINETESLTSHESKFSGIWYPTFVADANHMFISSSEYIKLSNLTSTRITLTITETSYYIKNRQLPIAKLREIIFHNLLFTIVCIEIFHLCILLCKLMVIPPLKFIGKYFVKLNQFVSKTEESIIRDILMDDHSTITTTTTTNDCDVIQIS
ncbi:unnamed protein product [Adineta ricciae]|uniref:Tyrosine-protein kinase ephrin type A/B receptor-like domain-containing protein n=2 Tax=Adineta ricciae TaxID=249248 RepID=A0A815H7I5_ADIRI|nr:unnamed protein product [Adineta ricciae]